ncbi:MAG: carbohydrate kinase [Pirellulales bacterium]
MSPRPTIIGLGEILWDVFPDGPHFGGAPANFACSVAELCGEEMDVYIVGSVGRDDLGRRAIELLHTHGVNTSCVSLVDRPTGQVLVELDEAGRASFDIAADTAWDNLASSNELHQLAARAEAVCFGTLGQRSEISRRTIQSFVRATRPDCLRILDINLRPPFWNEEIVLQSFELANMLKLNDSELGVVGNMLGWRCAVDELLEKLIDTYSFKLVALTRGADGAVLRSASGQQSDLPGQPVAVVDTVGAGDAFSAVLAIGTLRGLPLDTINAWGIRVAAFVCSQPGATPHLHDHLRHPKRSAS